MAALKFNDICFIGIRAHCKLIVNFSIELQINNIVIWPGIEQMFYLTVVFLNDTRHYRAIVIVIIGHSVISGMV